MTLPDTIHVLGFTRKQDEMQRTCREVERIGFRAEPFWNFPSPYTPFIQQHVKRPNSAVRRNPAFINSGYGHYSLISLAVHLYDAPVFVVEDDCRFLNDIAQVRSALARIPDDADLVLLEHSRPGTLSPEVYAGQLADARDGWAKVSGARGAASYICTVNGAKKLIRAVDNGILGGVTRAFDQWFETSRLGGINIYCAVPLLAIQQEPPERPVIRQSPLDRERRYGCLKLDFAQYAAW